MIYGGLRSEHDHPVRVETKFCSMRPLLDERTRRALAANAVVSLDFRGISLLHGQRNP